MPVSLKSGQIRRRRLGRTRLVRTPHLDRLADRGVRFDAAYGNSPLCVPSRLSFTAGQYISRCGGWSNSGRLPAVDYPSLPRALNAAGYQSFLCGKQHDHHAHRYGFTDILPDSHREQGDNRGHHHGRGERPAGAARPGGGCVASAAAGGDARGDGRGTRRGAGRHRAALPGAAGGGVCGLNGRDDPGYPAHPVHPVHPVHPAQAALPEVASHGRAWGEVSIGCLARMIHHRDHRGTESQSQGEESCFDNQDEATDFAV